MTGAMTMMTILAQSSETKVKDFVLRKNDFISFDFRESMDPTFAI